MVGRHGACLSWTMYEYLFGHANSQLKFCFVLSNIKPYHWRVSLCAHVFFIYTIIRPLSAPPAANVTFPLPLPAPSLDQVFAEGMRKDLGYTAEMVNRLFPRLDDLIAVHMSFLRHLRERQRRSLYVEEFGDLLLDDFGGEIGDKMRDCYGEFCSKHTESVALYKDMLKADRRYVPRPHAALPGGASVAVGSRDFCVSFSHVWTAFRTRH